MNKWVYYVVLLLTFSCFIGIQSSYAIVKDELGVTFNVSEEQFGTLWVM